MGGSKGTTQRKSKKNGKKRKKAQKIFSGTERGAGVPWRFFQKREKNARKRGREREKGQKESRRQKEKGKKSGAG